MKGKIFELNKMFSIESKIINRKCSGEFKPSILYVEPENFEFLDFLESKSDLTSITKNEIIFEKIKKISNEVILKDIEVFDTIKDNDLKKYDIIIINEIECFVDVEKVLKKTCKLLKEDGFVICSIYNMGYISNRLKILNGDITFEKNGIFKKEILHNFSLELFLLELELCGYKINELCRIEKKFDILEEPDLKYEVISLELIKSILKDPESTTYQYILKIFPKIKNIPEIKKQLMEFSKNIVTEDLKNKLDPLKENNSITENIILKKNEELKQMEIKMQRIQDSTTWKFLRLIDKLRKK